MAFLLLSIISSTLIFVTFKMMGRSKTDLLAAIVINYYAATLLGFILFSGTTISWGHFPNWLPSAAFIGFLFVVMFFLIGKSTREAGITPTTVAAKMSMVVPILFSILYFSERVTIIKITGIITACIAVFLAVYKKERNRLSIGIVLLPLIIFFGSGFIDSCVKFAQHFHIPANGSGLFSTALFTFSALIGTIIILFQKNGLTMLLKGKNIVFGVFLGVFNFGSLYFFINALSHSGIDSSIIFGINNISIVSLSVLIGKSFFKERISSINWVGILLSILSIIILTSF